MHDNTFFTEGGRAME